MSFSMPWSALFVTAVAALGCAPPRAFVAVQEGRITLKTSEQDVLREAGPPELILATRRVETFYYQRDDVAVSISLLDGKVVAFNDTSRWPAEAAQATDDADEAVATGRVRVDMTEAEVRKQLGDPDGITASGGLETLHWLGGDTVDSVVHVRGGKVVGFWDRPVSEFSQNLPTGDRDVATTSGRVRVGMAAPEVEQLLGKPDGISGKEGSITHRYESDPVFGDTIFYSVVYRDGKVTDFFEFNVSREKDRKEEEEARRVAAEAEARRKKAESSIFAVLANPAVQAALGAALAGSSGGQSTSASSSSVSSTTSRELEINGTKYTGGALLGQPCSLEEPCPSAYKCHIIGSSSGMCVQ
jgi:hypothetical protein